jgi:dTDP-glucose 4,6-dehydratase
MVSKDADPVPERSTTAIQVPGVGVGWAGPTGDPPSSVGAAHPDGGGLPLRTVITGGAGFIGSHLCERFLNDGHDVVCVDNLLTGSPRNIAHLSDRPGFRFLEHNVSEPIEIEGPVDNVLHFASPASPADYLAHPIPTLKVGSLGTHNALGLAKAKDARFLLASTSEVYGDPEVHPQREDYWGHVNPIGPRGCYDEAKRFAEAITMAYHRYHGVKTRIVRIFNTYGPRMRLNDGRVLPNFMHQALRGRPLTVYGRGDQTRSFCYVSDLVEGIVRLLNADYSEPVNLGNPAEITVLQLAEEIIALVEGTASTIVYEDLPQDDPKRRKPDITRARTLLGWQPTVNRSVGLRHSLEYFRGVV